MKRIINFFLCFILMICSTQISFSSENECKTPTGINPSIEVFDHLCKEIESKEKRPSSPALSQIQKLKLQEPIKESEKISYLRNLEVEKIKNSYGIISESSELYHAVNTIFKETFKDAGLNPEEYKFVIVDSEEINASINLKLKLAQFNFGLLEFLHKKKMLNKAAIRFIIGNEVAHTLRNKDKGDDPESAGERVKLADHYAADRYSLQLLDKRSNPVEGMNVLEAFESIGPNEDEINVTTTHPHSHRRKMKSYFDINNEYWTNLFTKSSEPLNVSSIEESRSDRFHFQDDLYKSFKTSNLPPMVSRIKNYHDLNNFIFKSQVSNHLQRVLSECSTRVDSILSPKRVDEVILQRQLPMTQIETNLNGNQNKINEVRAILLKHKVIDDGGSIIRKVASGSEYDELYNELMKPYDDGGYNVNELLKTHINERDRMGSTLGEKFLSENNISEEKIDEFCGKEGSSLIRQKIESRILELENKYNLKFKEEDKKSFYRKLMANSLESAKFVPSIDPSLKVPLLSKIKELSQKDRTDGSSVTTEEAENFYEFIANGKKIENVLFQNFYSYFKENNQLRQIPPDIFTRFKEIEGNGKSLKWVNLLKEMYFYTLDLSGKMDEISNQLDLQEDIKKILIDHLLTNGGSIDGYYCSRIFKLLPKFKSSTELIDFYKETLRNSQKINSDCLSSESFAEMIIKFPLPEKDFESFIRINFENPMMKKNAIKSLPHLIKYALESKVINPQKAIQIYDKLIKDYKLENSDESIQGALAHILENEPKIETRLQMFTLCSSCSTYGNWKISKLLCESDYMKCVQNGIWFPLNIIFSNLKSPLEKEELGKKIRSQFGEYKKRFSLIEYSRILTELNWYSLYDKEKSILENQSFIDHLTPSDANRLMFYSHTREHPSPYFLGGYKKSFPDALEFLNSTSSGADQSSTAEEKVKKCEIAIKFTQNFYETSPLKLSDQNGFLIFAEGLRLTNPSSYWRNYIEPSLEPLERALKYCQSLEKDELTLTKKLSLILKIFKKPSQYRNAVILEAMKHDPLTDDPDAFEQKVNGTSTRIFDLLEMSELKEIVARKLIEKNLTKRDKPFKNFMEVKNFLDLYTGASSGIRREFFTKLLQKAEISIEDLKHYNESEQKDLAKSIRENSTLEKAHEIAERVTDLIENSNPEDKLHLFMWLIGKEVKPKIVSDFEDKSKFNLDEWPKILKLGTEGEKFSFLTTLLLGPKGIFANQKVNDQFITDLYKNTMGLSSNRNDDFLFVLLKTILKECPQTRKMTLIYALFDEMLAQKSNINKTEEEIKKQKNLMIKKFLSSFGTVGVKLGQILSKQQGLIKDRDLLQTLEDLSDKVNPIDKRFILAALEQDKIDSSQIATINQLLGSASLKQVYLIKLKNGKERTIKFNRPMSYYEIPENLEILGRVLRNREVKDKLPISQELYGAIKTSVTEELNIQLEMEYQDSIRDFVMKSGTKKMDDWTLEIPSIEKGLKGARLYSDEVVKGVPLRQSVLDSLAPKDFKSVSKLILTTLFEQIFNHGLYHADLHGGNILLDIQNKKVGLIDFGNCGKISSENRDLFAKLIISLSKRDSSKVVPILASMLASKKDLDLFKDIGIQEQLKKVMTIKEGDPIEKRKVSSQIRQIKLLLDKNGISFGPQLEVLLKVFDTIEYVTKKLDPKDLETILINAIGKFKTGFLYLFKT